MQSEADIYYSVGCAMPDAGVSFMYALAISAGVIVAVLALAIWGVRKLRMW